MSDARPKVPPRWLEIPDPLAGQRLAPATRARAAPPRSAAPTRRQIEARRAAAWLAALAWGALVLAIARVRCGGSGHLFAILGQSALWLVLAAVSVRATSPGPGRPLGPPPARALAIATLVPVLFGTAAVLWRPGGTLSGAFRIGPARTLVACLGLDILTTAPILVLAAWAWAHGFPVAARQRAACLGGAAGLVGAAVLTLHCGSVLGGHILVGHGLPLLAATLVGGWFLARTGRP